MKTDIKPTDKGRFRIKIWRTSLFFKILVCNREKENMDDVLDLILQHDNGKIKKLEKELEV